MQTRILLSKTRKTELPSAGLTRVFQARLGARTAPFALIGLVGVLVNGARAQGLDPAAIMEKMAARVETAAEARRQYVYQQMVRTNLIRSDNKMSRWEKREYTVTPDADGTRKELVSLRGEYREGNKMVPYSEKGKKYKESDVDAELADELTDDLVNEKKSKDGIPHSLFPLRSKDLGHYKFTSKGEEDYRGRRSYRIAYEPAQKTLCVVIGDEEEASKCEGSSWKGEIWVDAEEFQPVRIDSQLAFKIPWGIRVFLGTNLSQTGFSVNYQRVAENVWFPVTYGTEFRVSVLFRYKRTITLALESSGFRKTAATSKIEYDLPKN